MTATPVSREAELISNTVWDQRAVVVGEA